MIRFLLILIIFSSAFSQTYFQTVKGRVLDATTETPLPTAKVQIVTKDTTFIVLSDEKGFFKQEKVPVGKITIIAEFMGYKPAVRKDVLVISGKELFVTLYLEESTVSLNEVVIQSAEDKTAPTNEFAIVSTKRMTMEEALRYAAAYGDPARMAISLAGITSPSDTRNDIVVRGNSPLGILWRFEGFNIPPPNHFNSLGTTGGAISILNPNLLADANFYLSAWSPEFGNALSGVFQLKMRDGNNEKPEFLGQIGFAGAEADVEGPLIKKGLGNFIVAYRYSTLELLDKMKLPLNIGATPQYQDFSVKTKINTGVKGNHITFFALGGKSYIEQLEKNKEDNTISYVAYPTNIYYGSYMGTAGLKYTFFHKNKTKYETGILYGIAGNSVKVDSLETPSYKPFLKYKNNSYEQKVEYIFHIKHKFNKKNNLKTGIFIDRIMYSYKDTARVVNKLLPVSPYEGEANLLQYYWAWKHKFSDKLEIVTGIYTIYFSYSNKFSWDPRFSISYQIKPELRIYAGIGKHSQMQPTSIYFRVTKTPTGEEIRTNKNLDFTKSIHTIIGSSYKFAENLMATVELYYQYLYDVPVERKPSSYSALNEGASFIQPFADSLINNGTGKNYGIDITLQRLLQDGFYTTLALSLYESKYKGSDNIWRNTAFNGNYALKFLLGKEIIVSKKHQNRILADTKVIYAGNRRYIPIDEEKSKLLNTEVYDYSRAYEEKYPDYFRIDLRIAFKMNKRKISLEYAVNIQNLTNRLNVFQYQYSFLKQKVITQYQSGIIPVGEFRIYF